MAAMTMLVLGVGCESAREEAEAPVTYAETIGPLFEARCAECHAEGAEAAGAYRVGEYLDALGCVPDGRPATVAGEDGSYPLLTALDRADHEGVLTAAQRAVVVRWLQGGARSRESFVHKLGILDPRSSEWHGKQATANGFRRLMEVDRDDACGRCHDGTPTTRGGDWRPLARAPSCTSCHDQPNGVLACGTCHGQDLQPLPPRDVCLFPDSPTPGAHMAHLHGPMAEPLGLECATCHPEPGEPVLSGTHGNGTIDVSVQLPEGVIWKPVVYDPETHSCTGGCHSLEGTHAVPVWSEPGPLDCQSCHLSPPVPHAPSACTKCHRDVAPDGTALGPNAPHLNGKIDLGDGSGKCGQCHGMGDSPWPSTGQHAAHRDTTLGPPVACETCHNVPPTMELVNGHGNGTVNIDFHLPASTVLEPASFGPETKSCTGGCHGLGGLRAEIAWTETELVDCQSCHLSPPAGHSPYPCTTCHNDVAPDGSALLPGAPHMNGQIDIGDGGGQCGACHGSGADPWPTTGAHPAHKDPINGAPVVCETCHVVPATVDAVGHLDAELGPEINFTGLAVINGAMPVYANGACANTACHDPGRGGVSPTPTWTTPSGQGLPCDSCHMTPPPPPHTTLTDCQSLICHGGEIAPGVDGPGISRGGRGRHVNGMIDVGMQ